MTDEAAFHDDLPGLIKAAMALLIWGGESARSFTTCMLAGIISGTYSTIFIAGPVTIYMRRRKARKHEERVQEAMAAHRPV